MPEHEDAHDATPPETPQDEPPHEQPPNDPDLITRRVLLHELLIEEYETHTPFAEETEPPAEPGQAAHAETDLRNVYQPALSRADVDALRPKDERDEAREDYSDKRVAEFFTLMTTAQRAEANERFKSRSLRSVRVFNTYINKLHRAGKYTRALEYVRADRPDLSEDEARDEIVDLMMAHEIYGILEDYRERARRAASRTRDEKLTDEEIESSALVSWVDDLHQARAESKPAETDPAGASARAEEASARAHEAAIRAAEATRAQEASHKAVVEEAGGTAAAADTDEEDDGQMLENL